MTIKQPNQTQTAATGASRPAIAWAGVRAAIARATDYLFSQQHPQGYWCGELEADSMLEADYIFLHELLGSGEPGRLRRALAEILRCQGADGSWGLIPGAPATSRWRSNAISRAS